MQRLILFGGNETKAIDLPQYPDEAFTWFSGAPDTKDDELYAKVSAVYRAMNLNAQALADLPFALVDKAGNDVDVSDAWENKIGTMTNPKELLRLWRLSLGMSNQFYGRIAKTNRSKQQIFYVTYSTIQPVINQTMGRLDGFKRGTTETIQMADVGRKFIYGWRLDHSTELLPSKSTEFKALCNAAGVLYYSDWFTSSYYKRGGIKPTLIGAKGLIPDGTKEDMEKGWSRFLRGLDKMAAKIFNAEALDIKPFGDGLGDLKETPVYRQAIENVAMATGIPLSLLLSNSANYATAQSEVLMWYRYSVTPWANFIAEVLNEQYFKQYDLRFEFRPEFTDPEQEDEVARAQAFKTYVDSGLSKSLVAQMLGLELPEGWEYDDLDEEPEVETTQEPEPVDEQPEPEQPEEEPMKWIPTIDEVKELARWQGVALRKFKRGEKDFEYETKYVVLPAEIARSIHTAIALAQTEADVIKAFEQTYELEKHEDTEIKILAESINKLAEATLKREKPIEQNDGAVNQVAGE